MSYVESIFETGHSYIELQYDRNIAMQMKFLDSELYKAIM